jgi:uncharacterized repeat protein (TIGR03806 family)
VTLVLALLLVGCETYEFDPSGNPPDQLSELGLFTFDEGVFSYANDVFPYEMNSALFTDYALKARAIRVPKDTSATWSDNDAFDFPVGTILLKSFFYPADFRSPSEDIHLIETRLLIKHTEGWQGWPYVWNDAMDEATLSVAGASEEITFLDASGAAVTFPYLVPQKNQCTACHELLDDNSDTFISPIGPKARHLHRDGQLEALTEEGVLTGTPALDGVYAAYDFADLESRGLDALAEAEVETAARDYLDVNCAHCHNARHNNGVASNLLLNYDNTDEFKLGVCKRPGSAAAGAGGRTYDIVPGDHDQSVLWYRMDTEVVGEMMPLLGRALAHREGVDLVAKWIDNMDPVDCDAR